MVCCASPPQPAPRCTRSTQQLDVALFGIRCGVPIPIHTIASSFIPSPPTCPQDLLRSPARPPTSCIASPSSNRIPLGRPLIKSPNAPTPSRVGLSAMVRAGACSIWRAAAPHTRRASAEAARRSRQRRGISCAAMGYRNRRVHAHRLPKGPPCLFCSRPQLCPTPCLSQPSDIPVPPVIRKLQLQSATLAAAAAADVSGQEFGGAAGDRRARAALLSQR